MTLRITCSWCGKDMGVKDSRGVEGVTHGICPECLERETQAVLDAVWVLRGIAARKGDA